jgi:cytochrome c
LIDKGAQVNLAQANDGMTALLWACEKNHLEVARLLIDKGASVNAPDTKNRKTSLMSASIHGYSHIVRLLLAKGARKDCTMLNGQTALSLATTAEVKRLLSSS